MKRHISTFIFFQLALFLLAENSFSIEGYIEMYHADNDSNTPVIISVMDNASVEGEKIYLEDLAMISASSGILKKIESIEIGLSPKPGREKFVSGRWILSQIQSKQFFPKQIKVDIPDRVVVLRNIYQTYFMIFWIRKSGMQDAK